MFRSAVLSIFIVFAYVVSPATTISAEVIVQPQLKNSVDNPQKNFQERSIRIASYNVLAESYLHQKYYPNHDIETLRWAVRGPMILSRILELDADILALQEVEPWVFDELNDALRPFGYEGVYAKKGLGRPDGCAIFFRNDELDFVSACTIFYCDDYPKKGAFSGHIALILKIQVGEEIIGIVNTHLRFSDSTLEPEEQVGYREVKELLSRHLNDRDVTEWVLVGDFNAKEESPVYQAVIDAGFEDLMARFGQVTTSFNGMGRIDYIFTRGPIIAEPMMGTFIKEADSLPNEYEPSDHAPVSAVFVVTQ